jgi:hypothetical protein
VVYAPTVSFSDIFETEGAARAAQVERLISLSEAYPEMVRAWVRSRPGSTCACAASVRREVELALNTLRGVPLERRWGGGAYTDAHRITAAACPREDSTRACPACDPSRLPPY